MKDKFLGYCKECGTKVFKSDRAPEYTIYECSYCGYPNSHYRKGICHISDLWDELPGYLIKYRQEYGLD
jgi:ribosomal protein L37E